MEPLDGERWRRIQEIVEAALERQPAERPPFLDQACAGDGDLRRGVESLLSAEESTYSIPQGPVERADEGWPAAPAEDPMVGRRIGSYRVERRLGGGGMGVVYLALRSDDEYRKRVALKVLRPGLGSAEVTRRFRAERQILAALDHPHIAQLLDGGTTEERLPYLVMEYIEGRPIDEYCEQERLSLRERLKLFRTVCSAVHFAHQNLVVHRDLKPGNVMVTADGTVKLLDFGIAKLLNPELSSPTLAPTATALRMMTPQYASPEQVRGEPISTASDVYSLGVLLYKLLTGHLPYRLRGDSLVEALRVVCEQQPERPSTVVLRPGRHAEQEVSRPGSEGERRRLHRRLVGDLDNIVLMAMRKEARRRYGSAEQLSEDVRRYLEGHPVAARGDTFHYRLGKLVRRNPWAVAASAAFVLACLGFALAMGLQRLEIARERDRVVEERNRAEKVTEFVIDLFEVSDPYAGTGETFTAQQILEMGSRKLAAELRDEPRLQARLMSTVGMIYLRLGVFDRAGSFLESALETRRGLLGAEHLEVAESLQHLAELKTWEGDYEAAEALGREALAMRRRLLGDDHLLIAESLQSLAQTLERRGSYDQAESLLREALAARRRLLGEQHPEVAESLSKLGRILSTGKSDFEAAEPMLRKALAMRRQLLGDQSLEVADSLNDLAALLFYRSRFEEAASLNREALAIYRRALGDEHPLVFLTLNSLANCLTETEPEEAEQRYLEALEIGRRHWGGDHPRIALVLGNMGISQYEIGDYLKAEGYLRESLAMFRRRGEVAPEQGVDQTWLAEVLIEKGDFAAAFSEVEEALGVLRQAYPEGHWWIHHAESVRAACLIEFGRYEDAERPLLDSFHGLSETMSENNPVTRRALARLIHLYESWGKPEKAAEYRTVADRLAKRGEAALR